MAQPDKNLEIKIPPFIDKTGQLEMAVKRFCSWFITYLLISLKIQIEPLLRKQKEADEKSQGVDNYDDKSSLEMALEIYKWGLGNQLGNRKIPQKTNPNEKIHILNL